MASLLYGLGHIPSPPDARDLDAAQAFKTTAPLPASIARSVYTKTLDQGQLGSCTLNATAQAVRAEMIRQLVASSKMTLTQAQANVEFLSRLFGYYFARARAHDTQHDTGAWLRNVFDGLNLLGFPPESLWPYSDDSDPATGAFAKFPSSAAIRAAFDLKGATSAGGSSLVKYSRITETGYARVDAVKRHLAEERLVVFGTPVSEAWCSDMSGNNGKPVMPPASTDKIAGGHAMVWGGYNADGPDTLNSWSEQYGDLGWFRMSWDYVVYPGTTDLWIVESAPLFLAQEAA